MKYITLAKSEVGWIKRTRKSDKMKRRRCPNEKSSAGKVYQGVSARSSEIGHRGETTLGRSSAAFIFAAIDFVDMA